MLSLMPWQELGFDEVLTATNGMEALELIEHITPDLIISDVRMPRMNGVQMLKEIRDRGMNMPFLFISGFSDKEYLMAAIRYHAVDYVEKPVMISELTERVRAIAEEMHVPRNWVTARALLNEGAAMPDVFRGAQRFYAAILLLSTDGMPLTKQQVDGEIRAFHNMTVFEDEAPGRTLLVVAEADQKVNFQRLINALNYAGGGYSLCLSRPVDDFAALPAAYREADACASRAYMGPLRGLQVYGKSPPRLAMLTAAARDDMLRLNEHRLYCLMPMAARAYMDELKRLPVMRRDALAMLSALCGALEGLDCAPVISRSDYAAATDEACRQINLWVDRMLENYMNPAVARAVRYIASNLNMPLSVSELAQAAFVSASRLNVLFHADTGVAIKQYVNYMRIETAKILLRQGCLVRDVAAQVGISDVVYFSKLFKRETGLAPSEFQ